MEEQFEAFRVELDDNNAVRERLRGAVSSLDTAIRRMHGTLLPVHHSASAETIEKAKSHLPGLRSVYTQLAEIMKERPGEYHKYHDHWRNQMQNVVFLLVFINWLENENLLSHKETEALLQLNEDFFLDLEDYLVGLCNLSNELPRYVVNQVTAGAYDCPQKVSLFLSNLYAGFRVLNLRNDYLRKRFDGIKYDLKKVEEVLYDVKIRGLTAQH